MQFEQAQIHPIVNEPIMHTPRRGLVLAGGGAKGAYAFGCMQALRDRGIIFEQVAGTSAGALNGVIWATQSFDVGERIWNQLSFDTMLPLRIRHRWLPAITYYLDGIVRVVVRLCVATWDGVPTPPRRPCAAINAVLFVLPLSILNFLLPLPPVHFVEGRWEWDLWCVGVGLFAAGMLYVGQVSGDNAGLQLTRTFAFAFISLLMLSPHLSWILLLTPWATMQSFYEATGAFALWLAFLLIPAFGFLGIRVNSLLFNLARHATRRMVFVDVPLYAAIRELLQGRSMKNPMYVCVAERKSLFEWWLPLRRIPKVHRTPLANTLAAVNRTEWVPRYVDLQKLTTEEASQMLLASAALPFGLLPSVRVNSGEYVDGGLADNVPIFPLVNAGLDELFVILLDCNSAESAALRLKVISESWARIDLLSRRADLPPAPDSIDASEQGAWTQLNLQARTAPKMPRFVVFFPTEPLGGFLSGTLNFNSNYARRLLKLGRRDAEHVLAGLTLSA